MLVAKQIADLITFSRAMLAFYLAWLGVVQGLPALPAVGWLMIANWTGDVLDGALARRSRVQYHSWIGDHDLEIDILISIGLLVFMIATNLVDLLAVGVYLLLWVLIFLRWGFLRSLGMLIQAPIYGWFIWSALHEATLTGMWMVAWIIGALIFTWPRFPREVVPGFLEGMWAVFRRSA